VGSACGGSRIEGGVFYSPKGYRVALPVRQGWEVVADGRADLELRRPTSQVGILLNATCEGKALTRSLAVLARHLTFGIQAREVLGQGELTVAGHRAVRVLLEGRLDDLPVRVEAYVVKGERCLYDMLYVAPPAGFADAAEEFRALVGSFAGP
jgi:hypothetical protein